TAHSRPTGTARAKASKVHAQKNMSRFITRVSTLRVAPLRRKIDNVSFGGPSVGTSQWALTAPSARPWTHAHRGHDPDQRGRPRGGAPRHVRAPHPRPLAGRGTAAHPSRRRLGRLAVPGQGATEHRAERGGGAAARGVRPGTHVLRRAA